MAFESATDRQRRGSGGELSFGIEEEDDLETWIMPLRGEAEEWCVDWSCDDDGVLWRGFKSRRCDGNAEWWEDGWQGSKGGPSTTADNGVAVKQDGDLDLILQVAEAEKMAVGARRKLADARKAVGDAHHNRGSSPGGKASSDEHADEGSAHP